MMVGMWGQVKEQATLVPSLATMLREYEVSIGCIIELGQIHYTPSGDILQQFNVNNAQDTKQCGCQVEFMLMR